MKHKLVLLLKTLFASKGFGQKTLEGIADIVLSTGNLTDASTDEEVNAAIESVKPYAEIMQAENTRYANEVKSKLPKTGDPQPTTEPTTEPASPADMPEWAKALVTSTQALAKGLESLQGEKVLTTRKQTAADKLKDAPEAFRNSVLADMDDITFRDDDHLNAFLERKSGEAALVIQDNANKGLGNDKPAGGIPTGGKPAEKEVSAEMKQYLADRAAEKPKATV